jgi:hypothetical protein
LVWFSCSCFGGQQQNISDGLLGAILYLPLGGGGTTVHMSPEEAQAFFSTFFGRDDPFGGSMFGGGGPKVLKVDL